jgi:hypothetical protein
MQVVMRQAASASGRQTPADIQLQEQRIRTFIGDDPVVVKRITPIGSSGHSVERWVLSHAAKRFLGGLLRDLYHFPLDLDEVAIQFVRQSIPDPQYGGEYDALTDTISLDVDEWNAHFDDRTWQLERVVHELVHAYQRRAYQHAPKGTRERDYLKEHARPDNYLLTQALIHTPLDKLDPLSQGNTEDQLAQRVMYEVTRRTGDQREYFDHWPAETLGPDLPPSKRRRPKKP